MAFIGNIEHFKPEETNFNDYIERVEQFIAVNKMTSDHVRKRALLLTVIGPDVFATLKSLVSPNKPSDMTYVQIVNA